MPAVVSLSPSGARRCGAYATSLEPSFLVDAFMQHPPSGFSARWLHADAHALPSFQCQFDLRTTLDDQQGRLAAFVRNNKWLGRLTSLRTTFVGTTVSEYALVPSTDHFAALLDKARANDERAQLIIIKDIPHDSPLLPAHANAHSAALIDQAQRAGFITVSGQALAYVPIDFSSEEDYLLRLSYRRRKEFRKKLRSRQQLEILTLQTGDSQFSNPLFVDELYLLYLNVYAQSKYHFDKLTRPFFEEVLQKRDGGGIVFLYRHQGRLIGFNLCFLHNNALVDKYIGLSYPEARRLNLYFVSWFANLEFARHHRLNYYVAGWTDPEVKRALGARFTFTRHAVYIPNPLLRAVLKPFKRWFEADANWARTQEESR